MCTRDSSNRVQGIHLFKLHMGLDHEVFGSGGIWRSRKREDHPAGRIAEKTSDKSKGGSTERLFGRKGRKRHLPKVRQASDSDSGRKRPGGAGKVREASQ